MIPTESAACGFSPHALNLRPNLVLFIVRTKIAIIMTPITRVKFILEKQPSINSFPDLMFVALINIETSTSGLSLFKIIVLAIKTIAVTTLFKAVPTIV